MREINYYYHLEIINDVELPSNAWYPLFYLPILRLKNGLGNMGVEIGVEVRKETTSIKIERKGIGFMNQLLTER